MTISTAKHERKRTRRADILLAVAAAFALVTLLTGCTATQAAYVRGTYAGQASERIKQNSDAQATVANYYLNLYRDAEVNGLPGIIPTAQGALDAAKQLSNPAEAAQLAFQVGAKMQSDLQASANTRAEDANVISSRRAEAEILAQTPLDVSKMADLEGKLASEVARHAAVSVVTAGAGIAAAAMAPKPGTSTSPGTTDPAPSVAAQKGIK